METTERFEAGRSLELVERIRSLKASGYRLVQIGCLKAAAPPLSPAPTDNSAAPKGASGPGAPAASPAAALEIIYSFDKGYELLHLRLAVDEGESVPSVSAIYEMAFLYENEIHDLFGVSFDGLALDFHGTFYQKRSAVPFVAVDGQGR